jgi:hypothetical protein
MRLPIGAYLQLIKLFVDLLEFSLHHLAIFVETALNRAYRPTSADPQLLADHSDKPFVVRN